MSLTLPAAVRLGLNTEPSPRNGDSGVRSAASSGLPQHPLPVSIIQLLPLAAYGPPSLTDRGPTPHTKLPVMNA